MILAIDHVAFSTNATDFITDVTKFMKLGYHKFFEVTNIKNPLIKEPLMESFNTLHDLTFLKRDNSYSVEIINHHCSVQEGGFIKGFSSTQHENDTLILRTSNKKKSIEFWKMCGFQEKDNQCYFSSCIAPSKLYLDFELSDFKRDTLLDMYGLNCIGIVVKNIERELEGFHQRGCSITSIDKICFKNKHMKVAFISGEFGELVELIEIIPLPPKVGNLL